MSRGKIKKGEEYLKTTFFNDDGTRGIHRALPELLIIFEGHSLSIGNQNQSGE